jgi:hypothetical protein
MTEESNIESSVPTEFKTVGFRRTQEKLVFVAFIDILGFGHQVLGDFDTASRDYDLLVDHMELMNASKLLGVTIRMFSDSLYLASEDPSEVINAAHWAQWGALFSCNWLVRGVIAAGRHQELSVDNNLYVVSEPLVHSVRGEKTLKKPCVVIHETALPREVIFDGAVSNFERTLLFYEGQWVVNPFGPLWGTSAADRVTMLKGKYPEHSDKYDWFLGLYDAVRSGARLLPGRVPVAEKPLN